MREHVYVNRELLRRAIDASTAAGRGLADAAE